MSSTFCLYPFTHIEIKNYGHISPCCRFDGSYQIDDRNAAIMTDSLKDAIESDHAVEIRTALLNNERYSACHRCWRDEDLGLESQRVRYNRTFIEYIDKFQNPDEYQILSYDLKLGNTCNQMCIICNASNSSLIASEEKKEKIKKMIPLREASTNEYDLLWYRKEDTIEKLKEHFDKIKHIDFFGGEPWLIKQHWEILEELVKLDLSKDISLNYATNGSIFEDRYFTDIFSKFKKVSVLYSADGIEETFNYCRYPGPWEQFDSNLKNSLKYFDPHVITCRIGYALSIYSVFNIIESLKYYSTITNKQNQLLVWFNIVNEPRSSVRNLPNNIKEQLIHYIESNWQDNFPTSDSTAKDAIITEIRAERNEVAWKEFLEHTQNKDQLRNINICQIIPELEEYFGPKHG